MAEFHPDGAVLVVDDEEDVRALLTMVLEDASLRVRCAPDARVAAQVLRAEPWTGLVLMDVRMCGPDGVQTLALLRGIRPGLRCCFVTGDPRPYTVPGLLAMGADAVFEKPFDIPVLVAAVQRLLASPAH
jgi:DNA-binding NtrC family response regulator